MGSSELIEEKYKNRYLLEFFSFSCSLIACWKSNDDRLLEFIIQCIVDARRHTPNVSSVTSNRGGKGEILDIRCRSVFCEGRERE